MSVEALRDMAHLVSSLPARTKVMKDLADILFRLIALEREAFGLNTESGTGDRITVIIRDFCGRGDPDSPTKGASLH